MPAVTLENTFIAGSDTMFRRVEGGAVILNLGSGSYFGLNDVGARIWHLLEQHGRLGTVLEQLRLEYDAAPDELERDLIALVGSLADARLGDLT